MSAWLVDTNLILRSADSDSVHHRDAFDCLHSMAKNGEMIFISSQTIYETWVVATRPILRGGLGWSVERARFVLDSAQNRFLHLPDPADMLTEWRRIVETYHITGYKAHDMRFVAYARLHRIPRILTFNTDDFKAVSSEITAVHPRDYLANPEAF
jgi:predicted nucleic acid-binding protein